MNPIHPTFPPPAYAYTDSNLSPFVMSQHNLEVLQKHRESLKLFVIVKTFILDRLEKPAGGFMDRYEATMVRQQCNNMEQMEMLLTILEGKGDNEFKNFIGILRNAGYDGWANRLSMTADQIKQEAGETEPFKHRVLTEEIASALPSAPPLPEAADVEDVYEMAEADEVDETEQQRQETAQLKREVAQLRQETERQRQEAVQLQQEAAQLKQETAQLKQETAQQKQEVAQKQEAVLQLKQELASNQEQLTIFGDNLRRAHATNRELNKELSPLRQLLSCQKTILEEKDKTIEVLQSTLASTRRELGIAWAQQGRISGTVQLTDSQAAEIRDTAHLDDALAVIKRLIEVEDDVGAVMNDAIIDQMIELIQDTAFQDSFRDVLDKLQGQEVLNRFQNQHCVTAYRQDPAQGIRQLFDILKGKIMRGEDFNSRNDRLLSKIFQALHETGNGAIIKRLADYAKRHS